MKPAEAWLAATITRRQRAFLVGCVLFLIGGLFASTVLLGVIGFVLQLYRIPDGLAFLLSLALLAVAVYAFRAGGRTRRPHVPLPRKPSPGGPLALPVPAEENRPASDSVAPGPFALFLRIAAFALLLGPWLLAQSWEFLARAQRLAAVELAPCAAVLRYLCSRDDRAPIREVFRFIPEDRDPEVVLGQLLEIPGVLLVGSPQGLTLTAETRAELVDVVHAARQERRAALAEGGGTRKNGT